MWSSNISKILVWIEGLGEASYVLGMQIIRNRNLNNFNYLESNILIKLYKVLYSSNHRYSHS